MIRFVIDECVSKRVVRAISRWNAAHPSEVIDAIREGKPADLPRRTPDPAVLLWAERNARVVVSVDYTTMPGHFADHLAAGRHSPGMLFIRPGAILRDIISDLAMIAYAGDPDDFTDTIQYIPL